MSICAILYAGDYAGSVGLTPEKFLNRFLKDFLVDFWDDNNDNGNAEDYLGGFTFDEKDPPALLLLVLNASLFAGILTPYDEEVKVTARVVLRHLPIRGGQEWGDWFFLEFSPYRDFKAEKGLEDYNSTMKNVRYAQIVPSPEGKDETLLERLARVGGEVTVTGRFNGQNTWNQAGAMLFTPTSALPKLHNYFYCPPRLNT
jgi:hypothetical protein